MSGGATCFSTIEYLAGLLTARGRASAIKGLSGRQ